MTYHSFASSCPFAHGYPGHVCCTVQAPEVSYGVMCPAGDLIMLAHINSSANDAGFVLCACFPMLAHAPLKILLVAFKDSEGIYLGLSETCQQDILHSSWVSCRPFVFTSLIASPAAPSFARVIAVSRPMPDAAPVII
jgi:hypothetical protein